MAWRVYTNISSKTTRVYRGGSVTKLPWRSNNRYSSIYTTASGTWLQANDPRFGGIERVPPSAYNRVYNKIVEEVNGPKGELLTSAVEWKSSLAMIAKRASVLGKAYSALRRFDLPAVAHHLTLGQKQRELIEGKVRKMVRRPDPTELWLEYWMGWAPLMGDIGHAVETLQRPPPLNQCFNVGVSFQEEYERTNGKPSSSFYQLDTATYTGRLTAYGKFRVTNHNLGLATALGFTNPILTAWQIVPFSFIVDWFTNIGQVLGSLTDFLGYDLYDTGYGYIVNTSATTLGHYRDTSVLPPRRIYFSESGNSVQKGREPSRILRPTLTIQLPKLSLTRAATSVSLLVEIFLKK